MEDKISIVSVMSLSVNRVRWTTEDLKRLPESRNRYEIIDGQLLMTRAPHWKHQKAIVNAASLLNAWSHKNQSREAVATPRILFSDADNVIPDVVWISQARLAIALDEEGYLTIAPELIIEVLSPGKQNEQRDRETKAKLYAERGVQEYWILDWRTHHLEVYRRQGALLQITCTLFAQDVLVTDLLPGFSCTVAEFFH